MKKKFFDKKEIIELYVKQQKSLKEIAILLNCGTTSLLRFMCEEKIPRRKKAHKIVLLWANKKHRNKMSLSKQGKNNPFFGKKHKEESKKRITTSKIKWHLKNPNHNKGNKHHFFGKTLTENHKEKIRQNARNISGENNPMWGKTGHMNPMWKPPESRKTLLISQVRTCNEYCIWRNTVYERDKYSCKICGVTISGKMNVDHIVPLSFMMKKFNIKTLEEAKNCKEIWDIANGRTLCVICHKKTDTYGIKAMYYSTTKS